MHFSWTILVVVMLLGVAQLAAGVVVGLVLSGRKSKSTPADEHHAGRLRYFARRLFDLVKNMSDDLGEHRDQISLLNQELSSTRAGEHGEPTDFVLKTIARILHVNERLQSRLDDAEERLREHTEQIESQAVEARTDPLTGLPNRRAFDDELTRRVAEWRQRSAAFCLVMVDIDHFKKLNDTFGHPAGDRVLCRVAKALRREIREMDLAARIGGEEFALILPGTRPADAFRMTERIRASVAAEAYQVEQTEIRVTVSLGLATIASDDDAAALMQRADEALYAAKHAGRNCGFFHNGLACQRITSATEPPPPDGAMDTEYLGEIYDDLRRRLIEVAGKG